MANKEAVFTLRVNTGNSVQDVQSFDAAINNLNRDIQEVQNTASNNTGIDSFEAKLQELNAKVDAGGLTMRQMTQIMKEYQNIAAQAGAESPIGQQAIQSASELKDTIGDLKAATTALSSDFVGLDTALAGVETGAAVFQGFESALALTGVESEALMQTMVKLQAVQGLVNAATTIANKLNTDAILGIQLKTAAEKAYALVVGETTGALKVMRVAMAATGIGVLIAGVALLVANFESLKTAITGVSSEQALSNDIQLQAIDAAADELNALDKLKVTINDETVSREDKITAIKNLQSEYPTLLSNVDAETSSLDELNKALYLNAQLVELKAQADALSAARAEAYKTKIDEQIKVQTEQNNSYLGMIGSMLVGGQVVGEAADAISSDKTIKAANERIAQIDKMSQGVEDQIKNLKELGASDDDIREKEKATEAARKKADDAARKRQQEAEKRAAEAKRLAEEAAKTERDRLANLLKIQQEYLVQIQEAESAYQDSLLTAKEQEENLVRDKYFILIQKAIEYKQSTKVLEDARTAELLAITNKYNDAAIQAQIEADQKKKDLLQNYQDIVSDDLDQQVIDLERSQEDQSKALSEALAANVITQEEYMAAELALENEYNAKLKEVADARIKIEEDADKAIFDAKIARAEQSIEITQQSLDTLSAINDMVNQAQENQIAAAQAQAEEQKSIYDKQQADELSNTALTEEQRQAITDKYNKLRYQAELKAFNEEDKLKKQQFERDKAFKIAQIAIDTASAITKAIATYGPPPNPLAIFGIATAGAIGIAQAAAVAATQYKSGTPPSLGSAGGGSMTGAGASTFTANTNTQQTNLSDVLGQGGTGQPTMSKVYVLESDITTTQQKVSVQEQLSTY